MTGLADSHRQVTPQSTVTVTVLLQYLAELGMEEYGGAVPLLLSPQVRVGVSLLHWSVVLTWFTDSAAVSAPGQYH